MRRFLLPAIVSACLLAATAVAAASPSHIALCFERQEVLPWRTLDFEGLNFEMLADVEKRTGVKFVYHSMPWKRCLEQLKTNQIDGAFSVSFNPGRATIGAFPGVDANAAHPQADTSKRMHMDSYVLVRPRGSRLNWDGKHIQNLEGRIGFQLGYSVGELLRAQGIPIDEGSQRSDELADKLIAGRLAGAALGGRTTAKLMHSPIASKLEVLPLPLIEKAYYLVFSNTFYRANPQLAARLWSAVEQARNSPAYRKHESQVLEQEK
jgi:polar amino acid transport system substrate-binding protein